MVKAMIPLKYRDYCAHHLSPTKSAEDLLALLTLQSAILRNTNGSTANTRILS